jgi:gluconolactonase
MTRLRHFAVIASTVLVAACAAPEPEAPMDDDDAQEEAALAPAAEPVIGEIQRLDPRLDALIPPDATIEKLADGFEFIEGPVWDRQHARLLFSDVRGNEIYQWSEADGASTFIDPVFEGDRTGKRSISSNGLTLDAEGRLIICEHGNRRISRVEADGTRSVVVGQYDGGQLNSPNDAVYASDGSLYFTDPPYGLEGLEESPDRELDFNGIYRLSPDGELALLVRDQTRPNGIALSPDETTLYVANSDADDKVWMAYDLDADGASNGRVFYDVNDQTAPGAADGMKVDTAGNLFATGPGGVWVIAPDGTHLGTISTGEVTANVGWGDDGRTLYLTASTSLYRIRLSTEGHIPGP